MLIHKDLKDFLRLLNAHSVRYLIVGGYAVAVHGYPRYTGDLDVFVEATPENAQKLVHVFKEFGFDVPELRAPIFVYPTSIVEIGREPVKLQVMSSISGVTFEECLRNRIDIAIDELLVPFIGYEQLLKNKSATGRDKDRVDVTELKRRSGKE